MDVTLNPPNPSEEEVCVKMSFEDAFDLYSALTAANVLGNGQAFKDLLRQVIFKKASESVSTISFMPG
jgi:hypothetical protein